MSRCAVISSSQFFNHRNNPGGRFDAGLGITLSKILNDGEPLTFKDFRELFGTERAFKDWRTSFRKCKTGLEAFNCMRNAFSLYKPKLSLKVRKALVKLLDVMGEAESNNIKEEIKEQLEKMETLKNVKKAKRSKKVTCDSCDVLVINGIVCHEHGCPNARNK